MRFPAFQHNGTFRARVRPAAGRTLITLSALTALLAPSLVPVVAV